MSYDLILLGRGHLNKQCPFDREVWTTVSIFEDEFFRDKPINKLFIFDRWPIHSKPGWPDEWEPIKIARERGLPIMGNRIFPFITEPYPLPEIKQRFGSLYFMPSISYMLALALHKGYKDIQLWGCWGPSAPQIHWGGRRYVAYWLGVATGMDVKWKLCPDWDIWEDCYVEEGKCESY